MCTIKAPKVVLTHLYTLRKHRIPRLHFVEYGINRGLVKKCSRGQINHPGRENDSESISNRKEANFQ